MTDQHEKIFGKHSVRAVFIKRPEAILKIVVAGKESTHERILNKALKMGIEVTNLSWPEFNALGEFTEDDKHQGIFALVKPRHIYSQNDLSRLERARTVMFLDRVTNPQNAATILRSAAFFHIDAVILMKNRSVDITQTVVRYAVGGAEFVDVYKVTNLAQAMEAVKKLGFWIYGLDERGKATFAQTEFPEKTAFVIGAEGEGLRARTAKTCDVLLRIPGGRKGVESLNAAVAATIAMSEITRSKLT